MRRVSDSTKIVAVCERDALSTSPQLAPHQHERTNGMLPTWRLGFEWEVKTCLETRLQQSYVDIIHVSVTMYGERWYSVRVGSRFAANVCSCRDNVSIQA